MTEKVLKMPDNGVFFNKLSELQELVTYEEILSWLDVELEIKEHQIPDYMVGTLYVIEGKSKIAERIMNRLDYRSEQFNGHTKPPQDEEE